MNSPLRYFWASTTIAIMITQSACHTTPGNAVYAPGSFGYDLQFLQKHDSGLVLLRNGDAQLIASARYQGKVFTSTAEGADGHSFGWIHYKAFDGPPDPHMNAYGGENRLWLGPEGGPFSLYFAPGKPMEFANWHTPPAFDSEPWQLAVKADSMALFTKDMQLTNYAGTQLSLSVRRSITLLGNYGISHLLGITLGEDCKAVGYRTENALTNTGTAAWTDSTGMPCLWMLDMFPPSDTTTIVIPYTAGDDHPANTEYFGPIPAERIKYKNNILYFKADGRQRGKLGIKPARTLPVAGSYDATHGVLTIVQFDTAASMSYLNQEWSTTNPPFSGDAMNAYNDGPLQDGSQMGPFYELESVSPAAFLPPGQSLTHRHSVFHFTGDKKELDAIAQAVLHTTIAEIENVFSSTK
ncbi:MAG: hypothetical protein JST39_19655 [Bacteroidetes bacterium]|nr:hypothetical protein [Bacteroidota bacterium]